MITTLKSTGKNRKKSSDLQGFTLIELIVVIVIIAILAAVAIPFFTKYLADAAENTCASNLSTLKRVYEYTSTEHLDLSENERFELALKDADAKCPSNGTYEQVRTGQHQYSIICRQHEMEAVIGETYYFTNDIIKDIKKNPKKYGIKDVDSSNNDRLTDAINNAYEFGKIEIKNNLYQIEPYYNNTSDSILIFAKQKYTPRNWNAEFLYNPNDGKWYSGVGLPSKNSVIMIANKDANDVYNEIASKGWREVDGIGEIRAQKK